MNDVVEQVSYFLRCSLDQGFVFDPLEEFVDADIDPAETSRRGFVGPDHIQPLACEGPRCRNRLQGLGRDMDLPSKKLTILTPANECLSINNR